MDIQSEFEDLKAKLKQQRDEINVKLHLAGMEVKQEWEKADLQWDKLNDKITDIADEAKETGEDVIEGAKTIAEELTLAYERIKERLKD